MEVPFGGMGTHSVEWFRSPGLSIQSLASVYANGSGALAAAPPTPPAPPREITAARSPQLIASGFGSGEIRHPAFLALKPHPCGLPQPPANASAISMGSENPRDTFRFSVQLRCR